MPPPTPIDGAAVFRADPRTVGRWADADEITSTLTTRGYRRRVEAGGRDMFAHVPGAKLSGYSSGWPL